jgi:hypothetical protein
MLRLLTGQRAGLIVITFEAHRPCVEAVKANFGRLSLDESCGGPGRTSAGSWPTSFAMESRHCGCGAGRETASSWNVSGERLFMSSAVALPLVVFDPPQVSDASGHKLANNMCYYQASGQRHGIVQCREGGIRCAKVAAAFRVQNSDFARGSTSPIRGSMRQL